MERWGSMGVWWVKCLVPSKGSQCLVPSMEKRVIFDSVIFTYNFSVTESCYFYSGTFFVLGGIEPVNSFG